MSAAQKIIAATTLLALSLFMHLFYCNWLVANPSTLDSTVNGGGNRTIVRFGSNSGILGRSRETVSMDALLGVAIPGLMVGAALCILAAPKNFGNSSDERHDSELRLRERKIG
jgi:hypothetical protein